ncbi:uncharacterized protein LOC143851067 [Tasmannia lanceolata]|uniref:uncharacterized protein LOC143851067 n=1 Tax=Tasmannia lanceolata TaxID=3420 RepID=UPI004062CB24
MDVWVVLAVAGAGYMAKYWQNVFKEREVLSGSFGGNLTSGKSDSNPSLEKELNHKSVEPKKLGENGWSCPLRRRLQRHLGKEATLSRDPSNSDERFSDNSHLEMVPSSGVGGEMSMNLGKYEEPNVLSLESLQPHLFREEHHQVEEGNADVVENFCYELNDWANILRPEQIRLGRDRRSLDSKLPRWYSVRPLSSLESCLIAQLYKKHVEAEEYVFSELPPLSKPTIRPFFITEGNQIISKSSNDSLGVQFESGIHKLHREDGIDLSVSESETGRSSISNRDRSGRQLHSQGSPDGMLLLCLGISIGAMSTLLSNKREVEKLNESLKQAQNLVQDLQEELEMKDSVTVKELANEACEFQEIDDPSTGIIDTLDYRSYQAPDACSPGQEGDGSTKYIGKEPHFQKFGENLESMSKIEAELEAELERLELNMNGSCLERRSSDVGEFDPDLIADVVHGELGAYTINGENDSDRDATGSSTMHQYPANYSVSPKELSLRLHELIQSRLEERIEELETALQYSQKRLRLMEEERIKSPRDYSNNELVSPSTQESPTPIEQGIGMAPPLFLNPSDDALNTYNEACSESERSAKTDEQDPPSTAKESTQINDQNLFRGLVGGGRNGSLTHFEIGGLESKNLNREEMRLWELVSRSRGSNEVSQSEDEEDDEMGKLLIEQIVEKTRQGSPVVLNAQRMLFSMDE